MPIIVFCEDCGKKNRLDETKIYNGEAVFRCEFCNYFNKYQVETTGTTSLRRMDLFLQKLQKNPGIIGSFIFYGDDKIVKNTMPDGLKPSDLVSLGNNLKESFSLCQSLYTDVVDMTLTLSDKTLVVKRTENNYTLILVTQKRSLAKNLRIEQPRQIVDIPGIDQFLLTDPTGKIVAAHNIKNPEKTGNMVISCGQNVSKLGKIDFKYLLFSRKNGKNFFIFPVGKHFLGVVKEKRINNLTFADSITKVCRKYNKGNGI